MRALVLGANGLIGRQLAADLLDAGAEVAAVVRSPGHSGRIDPRRVDVRYGYENVPEMADLRFHDIVVDCVSDDFQAQRRVTEALNGWPGLYVLLSSRAVYLDPMQAAASDDAPIHDAAVEMPAILTPVGYARIKVACEQNAAENIAHRLVLRPGFVVGKVGHGADGLRSWVTRVARSRFVAPDTPDTPLQLLDVRDLSKWVVHLVRTRTTGIFAAGPPQAQTWGDLISACSAASGLAGTPAWIHSRALLDRGVKPFADLPFWAPAVAEMAWFHRLNIARAVAAGLSGRSMPETVAWCTTGPDDEMVRPEEGEHTETPRLDC